MGFISPMHRLSSGPDSPRSPASGMFISICRKVRKKTGETLLDEPKTPKSPLSRPKQFLKSISKVFVAKKRNGGDGLKEYDQTMEEGEDWGKDGVWQREILMGYKCQPLDYAGVIYYDSNGKQVSEAPFRSPRLTPLPGYLTK